jgi:hypothetical protein
MGAMINILYDAQKVTDKEADALAQSIQKLVMDVMTAKDVFVYAQKPLVTLADPLEVFIRVNRAEVKDPAELTKQIASRLSVWKQENDFGPAININVHPVEWHYKIGI